MIKKLLLTFAILAAGHYVIITAFSDSIRPISTDIQTQNLYLANRYIDDGSNYPVVIVGSSAASKLNTDSLFPDAFNLSFDGRSAYEGLEIIKRKNYAHKLILVESNLLTRPADPRFLDKIFRPKFRLIPDTRSERPIEYSISYLINLLKRVAEKSNSLPHSEEIELTKETQQQIVLKNIALWERTPPLTDVEENFEELSELIKTLQNRGIAVVFFEMPFDSRINETASVKLNTNMLQAFFPELALSLLKDHSDHKYEFDDGIHLNARSADSYLRFLVERLAQTGLFASTN